MQADKAVVQEFPTLGVSDSRSGLPERSKAALAILPAWNVSMTTVACWGSAGLDGIPGIGATYPS